MIITVNEQNASLYNALFAKAYQALEAIGKLRPGMENDEKRFLNLDDYFAHMGDLLAIDPNYMMLPLDEQPFTINANTRLISAPKIVTLQNDQIAEILMFTIDRYFDYMDLYNPEIYIQWTLPSGKEGATAIEMKDITSLPGKIRFGWPLDSEITSEPGAVKYSVRFWQKDQTLDNIVYSFNTLTSSFTVSPALQPTINPDIEINKPINNSLFAKAVRNSQITTGSAVIPLPPTFGEPGLNLPVYASLTENTLTLKAQASVGDNGSLEYEWYYKPATTKTIGEYTFNAGMEYPYTDVTDDESNVIIKGFNSYGGEVIYNSFELVDLDDMDSLVTGQQYYIQEKDEEDNLKPNAYVAYSGTEIPEGEALYTRFTTYTVPEGDVEVTGEYYVRAVNSNRFNQSNPTTSQICRLVSPDAVTVVTDLQPQLIMPADGAQLKIVTAQEENKNATMTFSWKKDLTSNAFANAENVVADAQNPSAKYASSATITTPGWYKVDIEANLNREAKTASSTICKVTFDPELPTIDYSDDAKKKIQEGDTWPTYSVADNVRVELEAVVEFEQKDYAAELYSEGLTYYWTVQESDSSNEHIITQEYVDTKLVEGSINSNKLAVYSTADNMARTYRCYVTNTLNNKSITSDGLVFIVR